MKIIYVVIEPSGLTLACDGIQTYAHKIISEQICTTKSKKIKTQLRVWQTPVPQLPLPLPRIVYSTQQQGEIDDNKEDINNKVVLRPKDYHHPLEH